MVAEKENLLYSVNCQEVVILSFVYAITAVF